MKFSHQLKLNCVPEWQEHYINYAALKRLVYTKLLDNQTPQMAQYDTSRSGGFGGALGTPPYSDSETGLLVSPRFSLQRSQLSEPLLGAGSTELPGSNAALKAMFLEAAAKDLARVDAFFAAKQEELLQQQRKLEERVAEVEKCLTPVPVLDTSSAGQPLNPAERLTLWSSGSKAVESERAKLVDAIRKLYLQLRDLIAFASLNCEGFRKICKKFDKETGEHTQEAFMQHHVNLSAMARDKGKLEDAVHELTQLYADIKYEGDTRKAEGDLKKKQRDHFEFERRTVFQEMMEKERYQQSAHLREELEPQQVYRKWAWKAAKCVSFTAIFLLLLYGPKIFAEREKQNCLALLVYVGLMWCFEAIPLYVTGLAVPFLVVVLGVLRDTSVQPPVALSPERAADVIFHVMYSQVIFLLLGGFVIAAALSKHFIAKRLATAVLARVGTRPAVVVLTIMLIATITSTFMSNVTAPVLCGTILQPILRSSKANDPLSKALIMGIALASNLGGMMSPISSPQNVFAIERMSLDGHPPSWGAWFAVSIPVALVGNLCCWAVLMGVYNPGKGGRRVKQLPTMSDKLGYKQYFVIIVTCLTVTLWCLNSLITRYFGNMGVIATIPMVAFCGFGILRKDNFNTLDWSIIALAQGGLALGEAVRSSGLLETIAHTLSGAVAGCNVWQVLVIFCGLVLVFTTFISHTVGAMVVLPIVQSIGEAMGKHGHPKLLVFGAALMCSGAMGLPVSGFPNIYASGMQDAAGITYVRARDFQMVGLPCSVITYGIIVTLGYWIMGLVGF